jgi:hypothetical protein
VAGSVIISSLRWLASQSLPPLFVSLHLPGLVGLSTRRSAPGGRSYLAGAVSSLGPELKQAASLTFDYDIPPIDREREREGPCSFFKVNYISRGPSPVMLMTRAPIRTPIIRK